MAKYAEVKKLYLETVDSVANILNCDIYYPMELTQMDLTNLLNDYDLVITELNKHGNEKNIRTLIDKDVLGDFRFTYMGSINNKDEFHIYCFFKDTDEKGDYPISRKV